MKAYTTNWLLKKDGKEYPAGKKIQLEDNEAEELIAAGVISAPKEEKKAKGDEK